MEIGRARRGLQKKVVASLLIVGFAPGIVALFATYLYSTQTLKNAIGDSFQQIASATARRIEVMIDDEIDGARHLGAAPLVVRGSVEAANVAYHEGDSRARERLLQDQNRQWEEFRKGRSSTMPAFINLDALAYVQGWANIRRETYENILVTDEGGTLVASLYPTVEFLHGSAVWWNEAFGQGVGHTYVSDLYEQTPGVYLLDVAVPVLNDEGTQAIGVVKLVLRRDNLMKAIMEIRVGEHGHGMLLNTEGTPLICPVLPPKAHLINDALMQQLMQPKPGWVIAADDAHGGHNSIVGYAPIRFTHRLSRSSLGGTQWYAFVRQDPSETYAPVYTLLRQVGMIGFGMVTVLASLGFYVGRLIVKPIVLLHEQADAAPLIAGSPFAQGTNWSPWHRHLIRWRRRWRRVLKRSMTKRENYYERKNSPPSDSSWRLSRTISRTLSASFGVQRNWSWTSTNPIQSSERWRSMWSTRWIDSRIGLTISCGLQGRSPRNCGRCGRRCCLTRLCRNGARLARANRFVW